MDPRTLLALKPWRWIPKMRSMCGVGFEVALGPWFLAVRIHPLRWIRPRWGVAGRPGWAGGMSVLATAGPISVEFEDYS